jgi:adenine deaminase
MAVNLIVEAKGGIVWVCDGESMMLKLPVAGIMSDQNAWDIARNYAIIDQKARNLGSNLRAPYMTLSFMALLVIPSIKLSDKGLFDGSTFEFIPLYQG